MNAPQLPTADVLAAPLVVISNALVALFAWTLRAQAPSAGALTQRLLHTVLVWLATIVLIATALGWCGVLLGWLLPAAASSCSLTGIWLNRRRRAPCNAVARMSGGTGRVFWIGWLVLLACLVGQVVVNGLFALPTEFDGLAYHIPLIDHWLQARSLYAPDAARCWTSANAEIIGLWTVAPFSGDFLIALGNLPFMVLWVLAALETGRVLGLSAAWRHLAVLAVIAVHTTILEADKAMNDVPVAACFFAAMAYGFRHFKSGGSSDLVLAGVATGLLAGVKYFALGYAALVGGVVALGAAIAFGWRGALRSAVVLVPMTLLFGGYWYLRNYWITGHPLYPAGAGAPGTGYPDLWETTFVGNSNSELVPLAAKSLWKMTGPCHAAAVFTLPICAAALFGAGTTRLWRDRAADGTVLLALFALLAGSAVVFICTPFAVEDQPGTLNHLRWGYTPARYGLCFLSVCVFSFVWFLQTSARALGSAGARCFRSAAPWGRWLGVSLQAAFGAALVWQVVERVAHVYRHPSFEEAPDLLGAAIAGLNIMAVAWLIYEIYRAFPRHRRAVVVVAGSGLMLGSSIGVATLSMRWHNGFAAHYDAMFGTKVFTRLASEPQPLKIAAILHRPYPFFGSARQHRVCTPHRLTTYDDFLAYMERRKPDIIASLQRVDRYSYSRIKYGPEWLRAHETRFKPLMASGRIALYGFETGKTAAPVVAADPDERTLAAAVGTDGTDRK